MITNVLRISAFEIVCVMKDFFCVSSFPQVIHLSFRKQNYYMKPAYLEMALEMNKP